MGQVITLSMSIYLFQRINLFIIKELEEVQQISGIITHRIGRSIPLCLKVVYVFIKDFLHRLNFTRFLVSLASAFIFKETGGYIID